MNPPRSQVLVWSDDDFLYEIIEANLRCLHLLAKRAEPEATAQDFPFTLLIMALSSPNSEPVVALGQAALGGLLGHIPLLIISDRPFKAAPTNLIYHLEFPFNAEKLHHTVQTLLITTSQTEESPPGHC